MTVQKHGIGHVWTRYAQRQGASGPPCSRSNSVKTRDDQLPRCDQSKAASAIEPPHRDLQPFLPNAYIRRVPRFRRTLGRPGACAGDNFFDILEREPTKSPRRVCGIEAYPVW